MRIITKYLFTTIISYVALVMLFLFGLQVFVEFIHEFPSLGVGNYGLPQVLIYVGLMLPQDIYQFFPMGCLLGFIIALGLLAANNELIVMRVSGMSIADITRAVIKVGLVLFLVMIIIGEVLSPMAQYKAFRIKTSAISGGKFFLARQGVWLYNKGSVTNISSISGSRQLENIVHYQFGEGVKLRSISKAATGNYQDGHWIFNDVVQSEFKDTSVSNAKFLRQLSELKFRPKLIGITQLDTDQKNLFSLHSYIKYRQQSGLDATSYLFTFWQRVFAPLSVLVMALLAAPFVFGSLRSATMGLRMLVGVIFGFGFYILHQFVGPMSIFYQVPPILASILPLLLFAVIGVILLFKVR